ncbi:PaaI family thioesterase [Hymenobacter sp. BT491]|uniref:PaaI family thioesterase n=1 Tax=Hymenobacter sp. BT491 TaxID=2766779 RepID=UPI0016536B18|nr:PaaI family thioesterase [Hymenobacter sp. BT491]MBC6991021.1 PaaI family thioesterase [Hymenobacter sp. BT491]
MEQVPEVATLVAIYNQINQYGRANGMELTVSAPGEVVYSMTVREEHLSSPGTCHGGVIAGLMDAALGAAALTMSFTAGDLVSTVEFKINYLHPVRLHDYLEARGHVEHSGKTLIVASADIICPARDLVVARALGTFNRYPADKRDFYHMLKTKSEE